MKNPIKRFLSDWMIFLILMSFGLVCHGQDNSVQSKTISEVYEGKKITNVEITNKYGQIIINTWKKNEVKLEVVITAYGKNRESAEKILERVDFDFDQVNNYLVLTTVLDRKSGFFRELINDLGDYSKTLLSKNKLDVDYELYVPENVNLKIENKFGDIFLADLSGTCNVTLSNGNLKAKDISGNIDANISFGNAYFNRIIQGNLELKVADVEIDSVNDISISSSSSEVVIHHASKARINSRNDKYRITNTDHIYGRSSFSKIEIGKLTNISDLDMSYGFLSVAEINSDFSKIELSGKNTDFSLSFDRNAYFTASLIGLEEKMFFPQKIADVKVKYLDEKDHIVSVDGTIGLENSAPGNVNIDAQKGDLKLYFITTQ